MSMSTPARNAFRSAVSPSFAIPLFLYMAIPSRAAAERCESEPGPNRFSREDCLLVLTIPFLGAGDVFSHDGNLGSKLSGLGRRGFFLRSGY
jgi:hypothetical protein